MNFLDDVCYTRKKYYMQENHKFLPRIMFNDISSHVRRDLNLIFNIYEFTK